MNPVAENPSPLHLVKLCVGPSSFDELKALVKSRSQANFAAGKGRFSRCVTRMRPRRMDELLAGGSIYWVIKGLIQARQQIKAFEPCLGEDGIERTTIILAPQLRPTELMPRRAFQGWRYLHPSDVPADLSRDIDEPPQRLSTELAALGLL